MNILTLATKRSLREIIKARRYRKYYSTEAYAPGSCIEIIDGNRKSPAIVLKSESASVHKQAIRNGSLVVDKLKLSKTGSYQKGLLIQRFDMVDIKQYLADPALAHHTGNSILKAIFPKKKLEARKMDRTIPKATTDGTLGGLSIERYKKKQSQHTTELQLFVDEVRTYFQEDNRYGRGSFSYYLGMCKKVPLIDLWQIFGESKQSRGKTRFEQKKIFWWKMGQHLKK